jgi:hypothetical protein
MLAEGSASMGGAEGQPWFWEGRVQMAVAAALQTAGWTIEAQADTARKTPGKDIVATRGQDYLWVTVKGFPVGTARTQPATQARHWFSHATFDVALYRGEDVAVALAVAVPDFPTYRALARRVAWLRRAAPFAMLWVSEDGTVAADPGDEMAVWLLADDTPERAATPPDARQAAG